MLTHNNNKIINKILTLVIPMVVLTIIDRLSKYLAQTNLKDKQPLVLIKDVFELYYLENTGAAFGILAGKQIFFYIITIAIIAIVVVLYFKIPVQKHFFFLRFICILIISGALGNLYDRIVQHYVVDFLYFSAINFPIFNIADIYVTIGAIAFIISIMFIYKDDDIKKIIHNQVQQ